MLKRIRKAIKAPLNVLFPKKWFKYRLPRTRYLHYFNTLPLDEKAILLESQHGTEINGNMFYLLKELAFNPKYSDFKIYITCREANIRKFNAVLENYGINNEQYKRVTPVILYTKPYMKVIASAKYLFNDNTFLTFFLKKEGQIYFNTWHGTPLKTLGKRIKNDVAGIGNAQKNFVLSDYLLYQNEYSMNHMAQDYMIENIALGRPILAGYPRNSVFLNNKRSNEVRDIFSLQEKKVYAYMPTWRGSVGNLNSKSDIYLQYYLYELDQMLRDDEILYVNLHPIAKKNIDFSSFEHIKCFPANYETYDFLNCVDCLITDYSSVMYDFALTGKKIVLFTFDAEDYLSDRGVYTRLEDLPFPQAKTVQRLLIEVRSPKTYNDSDFLHEYCAYDNENTPETILDFVLFGKKSVAIEERNFEKNGKENILFYVGNLEANGITTAATKLMSKLDANKYNYYVSFPASSGRQHADTIADFPESVDFFSVMGNFDNLSYLKHKIWKCYRNKKFPTKLFTKLFDVDLRRENERIYGGAHFDQAIQFNGYGLKTIMMYCHFDCPSTIFVHSDMNREIELKGNQRKSVLKYAYEAYDNVALVSEGIWDSTEKFVKDTRNFSLVHNIIDYEEILEKSKHLIRFDENNGKSIGTRSNRELSDIESVLSSEKKVIINIGRFSPEKGHKRLIDAFYNVWKDNQNTALIIIGGIQRDDLYDDLVRYVETLPCKEDIYLILKMSNVMPILKRCDGLILSSFYEGFGLVLAEADILGVPVISTDIDGPRAFLQENNGTLVEDSQEGLEQGMKNLIRGDIPLLTVNYEEYNQRAIREFENLFN